MGTPYSEEIKVIDQDLTVEDGEDETIDISVSTGELAPGLNAVPFPDWLTLTPGATTQEEIEEPLYDAEGAVIAGESRNILKTVRTATLSGTPTESGVPLINITATDSYGLTSPLVFGLNIGA